MENNSVNNIARLFDVEMNVTVRFGKATIPLREVVRFGVGTMIELDRTIDEPVELLVNDYPFASGEVVVIDGYYGVRIMEIGSAEERSQTLLSTPSSEKAALPKIENAPPPVVQSAPPVAQNEPPKVHSAPAPDVENVSGQDS